MMDILKISILINGVKYFTHSNMIKVHDEICNRFDK